MNSISRNRFAHFITFVLLLLMSCGGDSRPPQEEPPFTPVQVPLYTFIDLGVLEGYTDSVAYALNDRGQVVGSSLRQFDGRREAFLWENSQMRGLGVLQPWGEYSHAAAINNLGQIVGEGDNPSPHSFFWEADGTLRDLFLNQGNESSAYDINDRGQVVGFNFKGYPQAYFWEDGQEIELAEEFGESYARAINNTGQIAGEMWPVIERTEDGFPLMSGPRAFLWENGLVRDLGVAGGASDINAGGQIVGYLSEERVFRDRAFLWQDGRVTELGHLGGENSRAEAINDIGQVVGASRKPPSDPDIPDNHLSETYSATLWERGRVRDLNQLTDTGDTHLQWAYDINNRGQIVGRALTEETQHGFLLTPQWDGFITRESDFSTAMEMGERLFFDYWADLLPNGDATNPFTIDVRVMDVFGSGSSLGEVEEQTASATWKTAFVHIPNNLIGTSKEISLQLSDYDAAADPIIFIKSFRSHP
jgi:probable HAF family extracellular repeat protein